MSAPSRSRRGVTVLEVLIAIGILAIGLSSVVALVPAARSQGVRAVILDRAAILAANTLADAATFGLLRAGTDTLFPSGPRPPVIVIDEAGTTLSGTGSVTHPNVLMRVTGIYTGGVAAPAAAQRLILQGRDDVTVTAGATADDPPVNHVVDGARGFAGRMTSLLCLSGTGSGPHRASVVVFHNRDPNLIGLGAGNTPLVTASMTSGTLTLLTADLRGRPLTDLIRPGTVAFVSGTFHQLAAATVTNVATSSTSSTTSASVFLTSAKDTALGSGTATISIQFLPDSVGLAERMFTPEGVGAFTQ